MWRAKARANPAVAYAFGALAPDPDDYHHVSDEVYEAYERLTEHEADELNAVLWSTREGSVIGYLRDFDRQTTHAWLSWWVENAPPATKLLDVGSGPGLLAAGYAALRPGLSVTAAEPHPAAADVTVEWARWADVEDRVSTCSTTVAEIPKDVARSVDQVVFTRVLANIPARRPRDTAGDALTWPDELDAAFDAPWVAELGAQLNPLVGDLAPRTPVIGFEKILGASEVGYWIAALQTAGAGADLKKSALVALGPPDDPGTEWMLRLSANAAREPASTDDVWSWLRQQPASAQPTTIRAELDRARLGEPDWAALITYPPDIGGGRHLIEVGTLERPVGAGWVWQSTSKRIRTLERLGRHEAAPALEQWRAYVEQCRSQGCIVELSGEQ